MSHGAESIAQSVQNAKLNFRVAAVRIRWLKINRAKVSRIKIKIFRSSQRHALCALRHALCLLLFYFKIEKPAIWFEIFFTGNSS